MINSIPKVFTRITNKQGQVVKHLVALREKKQYRHQNKAVVVQGRKTISELYDRGVEVRSLVVTAKKEPQSESDIKYPASYVLEHYEKFPAQKYYVTDVNITRKILGTASKPDNHEIFAEVTIPDHEYELTPEMDRLVILDGVKDPGNLGTLVRTAQALGWQRGVLTAGTSCDLFSDKTIRASRAVSLNWPHKILARGEWMKLLKEKGFTPVVADMLPNERLGLWSPEHGDDLSKLGLGSGAWFWNFHNRPRELPKKIALILTSEHHGAHGFDSELKVSVPMHPSVESLNVAIAGSILLSDLNRIMPSKNRSI
ncbi:Alpha/beta knot methyltransferase [Cokeromyces recurvatus]|uniref:Alpha/beta knot methyltransferase n=1 Tax=Cokeromyces recurvatus TaxID=90255 RepID=UPI00221F787B|nr:Alpha/beta knot methyltransferase [Cokeromyces recurvatus]KAI7900879.1 Alpha/beta knot methyltransferase [Cokeromyces recurvatus]